MKFDTRITQIKPSPFQHILLYHKYLFSLLVDHILNVKMVSEEPSSEVTVSSLLSFLRHYRGYILHSHSRELYSHYSALSDTTTGTSLSLTGTVFSLLSSLWHHSVDYDPAKSDGQLCPNDEIIKVGGYNV